MAPGSSPRVVTLTGPRGPVEVLRSGEGPALLLLAGLGSRWTIWGELPAFLARRCTVLAPNNRGVGGSAVGEAFTVDGAVADAAFLLEHFDFPQAAVLGVSMGGILASLLAARHPHLVRRLVVASCGVRSTPHHRRVLRFFDLVTSRLEPADAAQCLMTFAFNPGFADRYPAFVDTAAGLWAPEERDLPGMAAQIAALNGHWDLRSTVARIACPVLALAGEQDPLVPAKATMELAKAIPGCRFRLVPGAAHSVLAEGGPALLEEVTRFLLDEDPAV